MNKRDTNRRGQNEDSHFGRRIRRRGGRIIPGSSRAQADVEVTLVSKENFSPFTKSSNGGPRL